MQGVGDAQPSSYGKAPALLVFADSPAAQERAKRAADAAGARIAAMLGVGDALERLDQQVDLDAILIELEVDGGAELDGLLDRIELMARARRCACIITMPVELIDRVSARVAHRGVELLCAPDPVERAAAISVALAGNRALLGDVSSETETRRLQQLSEEVGRIARALASLSAEGLDEALRRDGVSDRMSGYRAEPEGGRGVSAEAIRSVIRTRRLRERFFAAELFADPAWDMLLDLMAARIERIQVAVSSLCIAASVPPTTALRWIRTMTDNGLFIRRADPADGRRVFIELSDQAAAGMTGYFMALRQNGGVAV